MSFREINGSRGMASRTVTVGGPEEIALAMELEVPGRHSEEQRSRSERLQEDIERKMVATEDLSNEHDEESKKPSKQEDLSNEHEEESKKPSEQNDVGGSPSGSEANGGNGSGGSSMMWRIATVAGVAVAAVAVVGGLFAVMSGSGSGEPDTTKKKNRKTMKAPGRDFRIYRDDFEENPKGYFRAERALRRKGI